MCHVYEFPISINYDYFLLFCIICKRLKINLKFYGFLMYKIVNQVKFQLTISIRIVFILSMLRSSEFK